MEFKTREHWEQVYGTKAPDAVSWYRPHLEESLRYIRATGLPPDAAVIDVGGGEATLVDDLLAAGYRDVTVLDISAQALEVCRGRLGSAAADVSWIAGDILDVQLPAARYDIWHDRAVFHFLTDEAARRQYIAQCFRSLKPGGFAIVGTFGPEGPEKCSGLTVARYAPEALHAEFGPAFELMSSSTETHRTPWGSEQQFVYCFCRRGVQD